MAYQYLTKLKHLRLSINGSYVYMENVKAPALRAAELSKITEGSSWSTLSVTYNSATDPTGFEEAKNFALGGVGDIDLIHLHDLISAGQQVQIFNPDIGTGFKINLTSDVSGSSTPNFKGSVTDISGTSDLSWILLQNPSSNLWRVSSMGFVLDKNTGIGYYVVVTVYCQQGSGRQFIYRNFICATTSSNATVQNRLKTVCGIIFSNNEPIIPPEPGPDQPYGYDDYDEYIGGDGDHDDTSDSIAESTLPAIGASNSGFCTAYVPTIAQIQELAERLTDPNILQALGNTVLNISDVVIGLHVLPVAVPKETSTRQVCVNFLGIGVPAGVYIDKATTQFVEVDCGSLNVTEYWGNCVDYNPYTQIGIFLPFCGFFELDTDDVMGKTIAVSYRVDIMSGACLATIKVDGSVLYQYTGDCANQIPVNSVNFDNFLANAFNMAIATSTGGAGLVAAGASSANAMEKLGTGGEMSVARQLAEEQVLNNYNNVTAQTLGHMGNATVGAVIGAKGQYKHAGCLAGSPGFLGVRKPYLIIKRPEQIIPGNFGKYHGFPANTGAVLGDLSGYTVIDEIRLNIPDATVDEILECEKLLKGGIVI